MLRFRKFFRRIPRCQAGKRAIVTSRCESVIIQTADVAANRALCREHYQLTCCLNEFPTAYPGQFVHLSPEIHAPSSHEPHNEQARAPYESCSTGGFPPMLRRAFSIAGLTRTAAGVEVDVIYRVVGTSTRWMESLKVKSRLSVMGPLGNVFPIQSDKPLAWLVAGGVGLPPMLWLAKALHAAGKCTVAFCGARTADLLPLTLDRNDPPAPDAGRATRSCREFAQDEVPVIISTDDGSLGFRGHIGEGFAAYHVANPIAPDQPVVYTCGPEPMMQFVAEYCLARDIECYVCMERSMACGTGLCQSCVVPVREETDPEGWRYQLCCTEGPIFSAAQIIWEPVGSL